MDKRRALLILILLVLLLNIFACFRWSYIHADGDMRYKIDHWTNKAWVEYYPALALVNAPIEVPLINVVKFDSYNQLEAHIKKYAVSGILVSEWIERTRLTWLYYGLNSFLIFNICIGLVMIIRSKRTK